jgi:hypothetical protein
MVVKTTGGDTLARVQFCSELSINLAGNRKIEAEKIYFLI